MCYPEKNAHKKDHDAGEQCSVANACNGNESDKKGETKNGKNGNIFFGCK